MGLRGEVLLMALTDAEEIEAGILGRLGVADEFADAFAGVHPGSVEPDSADDRRGCTSRTAVPDRR